MHASIIKLTASVMLFVTLTGCASTFSLEGEVMKLAHQCDATEEQCTERVQCLSDQIKAKEKELLNSKPMRSQRTLVKPKPTLLSEFALALDQINSKGNDDEESCFAQYQGVFAHYAAVEKQQAQQAKMVLGAIAVGAAVYAACHNGGCSGNNGYSQANYSGSTGYTGNCPCPYDRDAAGKLCGARSAYSRSGGASPVCYQ